MRLLIIINRNDLIISAIVKYSLCHNAAPPGLCDEQFQLVVTALKNCASPLSGLKYGFNSSGNCCVLSSTR